MSLPRIRSYRYQLPEQINTVQWQVDPQQAGLLIHDMQNHFIDIFDRSQPDSQINRAIHNIQLLRDWAQEEQVPVYYTAQPAHQDPKDRALLTDFWGQGIASQEAAQILAELKPRQSEEHITKWRYSAFERTNLEALLKERGLRQLIITGVYAHIGCLSTALQAFMLDIEPFFIADALADFNAQDHAMACQYAAKRCARLLNTDQLLQETQRGRA